MQNNPQLLRFRRQLNSLTSFEGAGDTTLVSLFVPCRSSQRDRAAQLIVQEQGTAKSIKKSTTKNLVSAALRSAKHALPSFSQFPKNGIAIFCGQVNEESRSISIVLEPLTPINQLIYRCDKVFFLEPLFQQLADAMNSGPQNTYGVVVASYRHCLLGQVTNTTAIGGNGGTTAAAAPPSRQQLRVLAEWNEHSVPNKHRAGGQSAARFGRQRL